MSSQRRSSGMNVLKDLIKEVGRLGSLVVPVSVKQRY